VFPRGVPYLSSGEKVHENLWIFEKTIANAKSPGKGDWAGNDAGRRQRRGKWHRKRFSVKEGIPYLENLGSLQKTAQPKAKDEKSNPIFFDAEKEIEERDVTLSL